MRYISDITFENISIVEVEYTIFKRKDCIIEYYRQSKKVKKMILVKGIG